MIYLSGLAEAPYLERFIKAGLKHLTLDAPRVGLRCQNSIVWQSR